MVGDLTIQEINTIKKHCVNMANFISRLQIKHHFVIITRVFIKNKTDFWTDRHTLIDSEAIFLKKGVGFTAL